MDQIILLTKNISNEQSMQNKLQLLGYEVYCSTTVLNDLLNSKNSKFTDYFKIVFISETIAEYEIEQFADELANKTNIVRIEDELEKDFEEDLEAKDKMYRLSSSSSLRKIRELLISITFQTSASPSGVMSTSFKKSELIESRIELLLGRLSKRETQILQILYRERGVFIDRNQISRLIWNNEPSDSSLAQLSQLINRIRIKMRKMGMSSEDLKTDWKSGYAFTENFIECLDQYYKIRSIKTEPKG